MSAGNVPRRLSHGQARSLLAERLDWPLPTAREAELEAHLAMCQSCHEADAAFRADRLALRQLPGRVPPRDLPARTLAALDAEARRMAPPRGMPVLQMRGTRRGGGVAIGSLLTVALVALVGTLLVSPGSLGIPGPSAGATPFAIAPVDLAFVGIQGDVVRLFRTRLDQACPPANAACALFGPQAGQVVTLPRVAAVSGLTLDPGGRRAAIAARAGTRPGSTTFYVVDLTGEDAWTSPAAMQPPFSGSSASATPRGTPTRSRGSAATEAPARATPTVTPSARGTPPRAIAPSPTRSPAGASRTAAPSGTGRANPRPGGAVATGGGGAAEWASAGTVAASDGTGTSDGGAAAPAGSGLPTTGPAIMILPPVTARAILQDVIPTGAGAAWSPDGSALAFSAMPADGSAGSDIYVWHPGQDQATALTSDHASSFASWADGRIVGSAAVPDFADASQLVPQSFVIDPQSGERRTLVGASIWLPSVDPTGRFAVGWVGTLVATGGQPEPDRGGLVFAPWDLLDPFTEVGTPSPSPTPSASQSPAPSGTRPARAGGALPSGSPRVSPSAAPLLEPVASALPPATVALATPEPLDQSPNPAAAPVRDWLVQWTPDGSSFATWVSPALDSEVGTLSLHAVDTVTQEIDRGTLVLAPVVARRSFSLGADRLCWATPPDFQGRSELRVALWGAFGRGELWSRNLDQQELVPAS